MQQHLHLSHVCARCVGVPWNLSLRSCLWLRSVVDYHITTLGGSWADSPLCRSKTRERKGFAPPHPHNSYFNINIYQQLMENPHTTNCPLIYRFLYFLYELVTDFVHFSVHFRFIVFVAFVYGLLFLSLLLFFFMRRRCISSDVLALEEKKSICSFFFSVL